MYIRGCASINFNSGLPVLDCRSGPRELTRLTGRRPMWIARPRTARKPLSNAGQRPWN
jgi:hypothetical protein